MKRDRALSASIPSLRSSNDGPRFSRQKISAHKTVCQTGEQMAGQVHPFHELSAVETGSATQVVDGMKYPLQAGSVFLIQPGQKHHFEDISQLSLLTFSFDMESIQGSLEDLSVMEGFNLLFGTRNTPRKKLFVDDLTLSRLNQIAVRMANEQSLAGPGFRTALNLLLGETILLFSRQVREQTPETAAGAGKLAPVLSFMEENFQHDIKLEDLAEVAGMSVTNFRRLFKNKIGESPIQYLLLMRLAKARELLMTTSLSVTDIAMKAGFNDANYFSRQFTAVTGLPPRVWRAADQKQAPPSFRKDNPVPPESPDGTPSKHPV